MSRTPWRRARRAVILGAGAAVMIGTVAMLALVAPNLLPPDETVASGGPPTPQAAGQGEGNAVVPGGSGAATAQALIAGRVTAVSSGSITIQGSGRATQGAVSSSTRVTGRATSIGAVEVGDEVSALLARQSGRMVVTAIQDPATGPPG